MISGYCFRPEVRNDVCLGTVLKQIIHAVLGAVALTCIEEFGSNARDIPLNKCVHNLDGGVSIAFRFGICLALGVCCKPVG